MKITHFPRQHSGAALVTALLILIVLTILSLSAARFTSFGKRIAVNDEHRAAAFQLAQSAIDATIENQESSLPITGNVGDVTCMVGVAGCNYSTITLPAALLAANVSAKATRLGPDGLTRAPRLDDSAASTFNVKAAKFEVEGTYNEVAGGRGLSVIREGILSLVLVPDSPGL